MKEGSVILLLLRLFLMYPWGSRREKYKIKIESLRRLARKLDMPNTFRKVLKKGINEKASSENFSLFP